MRGKNVRAIIIITLITIVAGISICILLPLFRQQDWSFLPGKETELHVEETTAKVTEKSVSVNTSESFLTNNSTEECTSIRNHGDFYELYWSQIEDALNADDPDFITDGLKDLDLIVTSAREEKKTDCRIKDINEGSNMEFYYKVSDVFLVDDLSEYSINKDELLDPPPEMYAYQKSGYRYAIVDIEIQNVSGETMYDVPLNCFWYCLIDDENTIYQSEFAYGTLQPNRNASHRYFAPEMKDKEVMKTRAVFYIPRDKQFEAYDHYFLIDPQGTNNYSPYWVDMLWLNDLIGN